MQRIKLVTNSTKYSLRLLLTVSLATVANAQPAPYHVNINVGLEVPSMFCGTYEGTKICDKLAEGLRAGRDGHWFLSDSEEEALRDGMSRAVELLDAACMQQSSEKVFSDPATGVYTVERRLCVSIFGHDPKDLSHPFNPPNVPRDDKGPKPKDPEVAPVPHPTTATAFQPTMSFQ